MENRINNIVELDNGKKYIILKQAVYKNSNYYFVTEITNDEKDIIDNQVLFEEIKDNDGIRLEQVTDPQLYQMIAKYLGLLEED